MQAGFTPQDPWGAQPFWHNGPRPQGFYQHNQQQPTAIAPKDPRQHTTRPMVTGTSVLAIQCRDGVVMAADTLGSYGSMARFRDQRRLTAVGEHTLVGSSGDIADYNYIERILEDMVTENANWCDGHKILPRSVHTYMTRILYNRRSKMNPLWNTLVIGGFSNGEGYLGYVDKLGVAYTDPCIATGYGSYIVLPIMRDALEKNPNLSVAEGRELLERCLVVLYYRDARSLNRYQIATSTSDGTKIDEPKSAETNWDVADFVKGYE